jgi:hypothetical protein
MREFGSLVTAKDRICGWQKYVSVLHSSLEIRPYLKISILFITSHYNVPFIDYRA